MTKTELNDLLGALPRMRIGVVGDFCLDTYWTIDMSVSEKSVETGLQTRPVRKQRYSLGGAGNVVDNLLAMGVGAVRVFGVIGSDPFGEEMRRILSEKKAALSGMLTQRNEWDTLVYLKPISADSEENRIDFGNFNQLHDDTAAKLIAELESALPEMDGVIVNQQIKRGIHTPFLQRELTRIMAKNQNKLFVVDSRNIAEVYPTCAHKMNASEAARLCGVVHGVDYVIGQDEISGFASELFKRWKKPVFVTNAARGCVVADKSGIHFVCGLHIIRRTDPVGAGDSMLAGMTAALAAGYTPQQAATFGNFVAGVTVQKIFQTGTASPDEIRAIGEDPDYVYQPELADDPRKAKYIEGTDIEIVEPIPAKLNITHAVFDHDGTLSTVRQGWEQVMEPVMIKAILGPQYESASETVYSKAVTRVRDFIDKTTGIQTITQMAGLVDLVKEFGLVPEPDILDAAGYKRIYNDALMSLVRERVRRLQKGELDISDFTLKNASELLRRLHKAGIKLYLASGTDEQDVKDEAKVMGYADLFEGRIYGATGNTGTDVKRVVVGRILNDVGAKNVHCLVTFGDGPVEIRETRKREGLTVGLASDEIRRFGLNASKRSRLIRAGAHLIVPDYSQMERLLATLNIR
jgi:rfaE bifunctional protein kinase chain/domain